MPFGIPLTDDDAFGGLINGIELITFDLTAMGGKINAALQAGGAANAADLKRPFNRLNQQLTRGTDANQKNLDNVAQSLALQLAVGARANAADLSVVPAPVAFQGIGPARTGNISIPPTTTTMTPGDADAPFLPLRQPPGGKIPGGQVVIEPGGDGTQAGGNGTTGPLTYWFSYCVIVPGQEHCCHYAVEGCANLQSCFAQRDAHGSLWIGGPFDTREAAVQSGETWIRLQCPDSGKIGRASC